METGLLHDVVEDTSVTVEQVRKEFGDEVARCVDGVTKLSKLDFFSAEDRQAESFRKMLLAMVDDIRVIMVKLADRLHNMRTLGYLSPERRERIARETIEIYAPIAHRLGHGQGARRAGRPGLPAPGAGRLRGDSRAPSNRAATPTKSSWHEIRQTVEAELRREGIPARIDGRAEAALLGLSRSCKRQKITIDQVYDLMALRIITDSVKNCYAALGVIHNKWRPIPGRIKDFIAIPRPNLYQSLHTSVVGPARADTSKCRSAPRRCTASPKKASRRTGSTRKAARGRRPTISASPGCATWWNGSATCRIPASSCPP